MGIQISWNTQISPIRFQLLLKRFVDALVEVAVGYIEFLNFSVDSSSRPVRQSPGAILMSTRSCHAICAFHRAISLYVACTVSIH